VHGVAVGGNPPPLPRVPRRHLLRGRAALRRGARAGGGPRALDALLLPSGQFHPLEPVRVGPGARHAVDDAHSCSV
jgi:hypothetical protein